MGFRFPLQAILELRRSLEHQEELRLRAANQNLHKVQHQIEQIDVRISGSIALFEQRISAGTNGAELLFNSEVRAALKAHRQALEHELMRLTHLRDKQQHIYQEARRQRETLASLRDIRVHEYNREKAREQQRMLDDLFLSRTTKAPRS